MPTKSRYNRLRRRIGSRMIMYDTMTLIKQQVNPSSLFTCLPWCMTLLSDGQPSSGVEYRSIANMTIYMSQMPGDKWCLPLP